ncbi:MAG: ABC transporter permease [Chloroflexota bacterium]
MDLKTTEQENWSLVIRPQRSWWDLRLGEIFQYLELIQLLVWRDFVAAYKQTILGPFWYVIQQLVSTGVYTIIFGEIAQLPTDGMPPALFYMAGTTIWGYFSGCLQGTSNTFTGNARIFGKVYFPRLVMPIATVVSNLISFGLRFLVFLLVYLFFAIQGATYAPNWWILSLPLILLTMAGLGLGIGIIISSMTIKYRDLQQIVGHGILLLMYATPVLYPLSMVPEQWEWVFLANPLTPMIEIFRYSFMGASVINPLSILYSIGFTFVVLVVGILIFNRAESTFMDTV